MTSASAASTMSFPPAAMSTSWCSTPRSTPTPAARRQRRPNAGPWPSSRPPARKRPKRTSGPWPGPTATSTWPRSPWAPTTYRRPRRLLEAEAYPGPSLVIAYSTCIAHGIDMSKSMTHQKDAVRSGYWPLYRFHPSKAEAGHPFTARLQGPVGPAGRLRRHRGPLCHLGPHAPARRPLGWRHWRRRTSPSGGATTSSWPPCNAPSPRSTRTSSPRSSSDAGYRYDEEVK